MLCCCGWESANDAINDEGIKGSVCGDGAPHEETSRRLVPVESRASMLMSESAVSDPVSITEVRSVRLNRYERPSPKERRAAIRSFREQPGMAPCGFVWGDSGGWWTTLFAKSLPAALRELVSPAAHYVRARMSASKEETT